MSNVKKSNIWTAKEVQKNNWHIEVHRYWFLFLTSHMKVIKISQNTFYGHFGKFLMTIKCYVKIDINMCEPNYVNLFLFVNLLHSPSVWFLDIWHIFDNLTSYDILPHCRPITYVPHYPCNHCPVPNLDLCIIMPMYPSPICPITWGQG